MKTAMSPFVNVRIGHSRFSVALLFGGVMGWQALVVSPALACPFCNPSMGKTLAENVVEADLVVHARLSGARQNTPNLPTGSTNMKVLRVIKDHPILKGKKETIVLNRFIPTAQTGKVDFVILAEVIDGNIDPYRGIPVEDEEFVDFLAGAVQASKMPIAERLGFFFGYLDHKDSNISGDAYKVFSNAPYDDVVSAGKNYDPQKIIEWIRDQNTPSYRIGLYGCLLGTCGKPEHAAVLKKIIDDPDSRPMTGVDGLMGGYCILAPKSGPDYVLDVLTGSKHNFNIRYSALRTVRFLLGRPDVDHDHVFTRMAEAIELPDISDLIIDEFRKNEKWDPLDRVLALYDKKGFDLQVVRRAIIRFALRCPGQKARNFVTELKKKDPQLVSDVEEILAFEESQKIQLSSGRSNGQ